MNTFNVQVGLEDFVSRIPAMFAYVEFDEAGNVELHPSSDSPNGCYGKIVENIHIPKGVWLVNYVSVTEEDIPENYGFGNSNTIRLSDEKSQVFSTNASLYLREVLWYWYEKTDNESENAVLMDSIPSFVGDDNPEEIKLLKVGIDGLPLDCGEEPVYDYYVKNGKYSYYQRKEIISQCKTYSYRTIISEYYNYKEIVGEDNTFIKFVDTGIGLIKVNRDLLNLTDEETYSEVPEQFYLSQIRTIINEYQYYQKASVHYKSNYLANGKTDARLKALHEKYIRIGGDNMLNWLYQTLQKLYNVSNEYLCHAENRDFSVRFSLDVMLCKHEANVGVETVDVNQFVPGNRYYDGDLLTYEGRTYVCVLDRFEPDSSNNYEYVVKYINLQGKHIKALFYADFSANNYMLVNPENIAYVPSMEAIPTEPTPIFIINKGTYYKLDNSTSSYLPINVTEYSTGVWDEDKERYVFDSQHFILLSDLENYDEWYDSENLDGEKYKFFADMDYLPSEHISDYVRFNNSLFGWNEEIQNYYPLIEESYTIAETTNSKLRDLRMFEEYLNQFGKPEEPDLNEDWLYYYKVNRVTGLVVETDDLGNILKDGDYYEGVCYDLHAYGNLITSITYNQDSNTITFEYVIGAHLLAEYDGCDEDVDGNTIRYYKNFSYDNTSGDGVTFKETYQCVGSAISDLGDDFEPYINGDITVMISHSFEKLPFVTVPVKTFDDIMNIEGVGTASIPAFTDLINAHTVCEEWMGGLYHQPRIKNNLSIDRGNGASFERHLRLGEIRTMQDFDNYRNGSYFNTIEN